MGREWLLALALLAGACAPKRSEAPLQVVGPFPSTPGVPVPHLLDILSAISAVEGDCEPASEAQCLPRERVAVAAARCLPTAPEDDHLSATCRVDWFKGEPLPLNPDHDHRGECLRFILLDIQGAPGKQIWAVRYTPPGYKCEVPAK